MIKNFICYCARKNGSHRHEPICDDYLPDRKEEYGRTDENNRLDSPQHGQADAINRENRSER